MLEALRSSAVAAARPGHRHRRARHAPGAGRRRAGGRLGCPARAPIGHRSDDGAGRGARRWRASAGGPLVVCGSLYLVGHVRGRLLAAWHGVTPARRPGTRCVIRGRDLRLGQRGPTSWASSTSRPIRSAATAWRGRATGRRGRRARRGGWSPRAPTCSTSAASRPARATTPVTAAEELAAWCRHRAPSGRPCRTCRSASTPRKAEVAAAALDAGADLLNDVAGVTGDGAAGASRRRAAACPTS